MLPRSSFAGVRQRRDLLVCTLALASLLGCQNQVPAATVAPTGATLPRPTGLPGSPSGGTLEADGHIQLLDVPAGTPANFVTQAGRELLVVASAATPSGPSPFRLAVEPLVGSDVVSRYQLNAAEVEGARGLPYRSTFTASTPATLAAVGVAERPARRLHAVVPDRIPGSEDTFWVNTGNSRATSDVQRTATLRRVTPNAYIYVDKESRDLGPANLDRLAIEFETKIYPRLTAVFGREAKPGVDGIDRLFIVISPAVDNWGKEKGLMGYFWSRDALPTNVADEHSNQKEALFMTDQLFSYPTLTSFGTLAHEFQHLINFSQKAARSGYTQAEETWLDEGLSMYAMEVAGYGLAQGDKHIAKDLNEFQQDSKAFSLTDWAGNPHGFAYGQSYLYVRYLVDRFGTGVIPEILHADKVGQDGMEEVLKKHGSNFASFFNAWAIANIMTDKPLAVGTLYHYNNLNLAENYGGFQLKGFQTTPATSTDMRVALRPWGTAYYTFAAGISQSWRLTLGDGTSSRLLGAAIVP